MEDNTIKRIARLTAIVTQLQTKPMVTATQLARRFDVSIRTIYRDIKTLDQAGIPILTEPGMGYKLMEGYKLPPVAFTETEANALVTAGQLISKSKDKALLKEYDTAISKVKAVLDYVTKEKVELLSSRMRISPMFGHAINGINKNNSMTLIQQALTNFKVLEITYISGKDEEKTVRKIEPFALYYSLEEYWLLIAYCRLRQDFRMFRLDRIQNTVPLEIKFKPHQLTLEAFLEGKKKNFDP